MKQLITVVGFLFALILSPNIVEAGQLSIRTSYMKTDLHKMEGSADSIQDQKDLENGLTASRSGVWREKDSYRYTIEIMNIEQVSQSVQVGTGMVFFPGYELDAVSEDGSSNVEFRVDGIGIQSELIYRYRDIFVTSGLSVTYWQTKVNTYDMTENGEIQNRFTIKDSSVSPYASISYNILDNVSLRYTHYFDIGTKSFHGSGPIELIGFDVKF